MHPAATQLALTGLGDKWQRGRLIRPKGKAKAKAMNQRTAQPPNHPNAPPIRW